MGGNNNKLIKNILDKAILFNSEKNFKTDKLSMNVVIYICAKFCGVWVDIFKSINN